MGFSLRRWLLATLTRRELGIQQLDWKYLRFSYSQFAEDLIAESLLPQATGFYVDVGAYHPVQISNTYRFYRKGWRGVVVDANPRCLEEFARRRPRDIRVHAVVSDTERDAVFEIHKAGVSSRLQSAGEGHPGEEGSPPEVVERVKIRTRTLESVLREFVPPGTGVDLLNVDCEHEDLAVLRSNDWTCYQPKVIVAEDWQTPGRQNQLQQLLEPLGYTLCVAVQVSRVFVKTAG